MHAFLLIALFVASYTLRWEYVKNTKIVGPVIKDAYYYTRIAHNLADNHVFSSAVDPKGRSTHEARRPGYPYFLSSIVLFTDSFKSFYLTTLWLQSIIGALTVLLSYALARFLLPKPWALSVAFLTMVSPHMIAMNAFILSECLFTFLIILSLVFLVMGVKQEKTYGYMLSGITMGVAIFVRPVFELFPLLCCPIIYFSIRDKNRWTIFIVLSIFLFTSYSFQLSWSLWERIRLGQNPLMDDQLKTALIFGTYPDILYKDLPGMPDKEDPNFSALIKADYGTIIHYILNQFVQEPFRHITWWFIKKPVLFWSWKVFFGDGINFYPVYYSWFDINPLMNFLRSFMLALHPFIVLLAGISVIFFKNLSWATKDINKKGESFCYAVCAVLIIHFTVMFMILAPFPRYALPMGPELYLLGLFGLRKLWPQIRNGFYHGRINRDAIGIQT